jgi:hypothetical protein
MPIDGTERLDAVAREYEIDEPVTALATEFTQDEGFQIGLVIDHKDRSSHAATTSLASILRRSHPKSIGLINRSSAPRSTAVLRV